MPGLIESSYNVEVSAATSRQAIFVGGTRNLRSNLHEWTAGNRAPINVVAGRWNSPIGRGRIPRECNAVRTSFMTADKADAKQSTCRQHKAGRFSSHDDYRLVTIAYFNG